MEYNKLQELLEFIKENNSWKECITEACHNGKPLIKYIRFNVDTRDMAIYYIVFDNIAFSCGPNLLNKKEFEESIYKYLNDRDYTCRFMHTVKE